MCKEYVSKCPLYFLYENLLIILKVHLGSNAPHLATASITHSQLQSKYIK